MASYFGRYSRNSQPVALFSAPPSVALGAPPSLALRAPPSVALRGLGAVPTVALGAAPVVRLGTFGSALPGESESECQARMVSGGLSQEAANYYCTPQSSGGDTSTPAPEPTAEQKKEAEKKTREWTGSDWESLFKGLGVFTKPIFDNLGRLVDPNTGRQIPLDPAMAMQYRLFMQQQQNRLPEWVVPVAVIAGIGLLAMVALKK